MGGIFILHFIRTLSKNKRLPAFWLKHPKATIPIIKKIEKIQQIVKRMTDKMISQFFSPNELLYGSKYNSEIFFVPKSANDVLVN